MKSHGICMVVSNSCMYDKECTSICTSVLFLKKKKQNFFQIFILDCFSDNYLNYSVFFIIILFYLLLFLVDALVGGDRGMLFGIYVSKIFLNF